MKPIQMVDLKNQYIRIKDEVDAAIHHVLDTTAFIGGPDCGEFECDMAGYVGVKYAIGCANGTDALQIAMMALEIGEGDEVITTAFSFVATTETIAVTGARPVYVDIQPDTYNIDPKKLEAAITSKTKAIIPVHLYGQPADLDEILAIAKKHNIPVIEDNAQSIGAVYKGKRAGSFGLISTTSFYPAKNLGCFGDGGMIFTNDDQIAEKIRMIANHGSRKRYFHEILGLNSRLDTIQAAILRVKLKYLDNWAADRQKAAAFYNDGLSGGNVIIPKVAPQRNHVYHQYSILVEKRNELQTYLKEKGIPTAVHYPMALHLQPAFSHYGFVRGDFPIAEKAADQILCLPIHTEMDEDQIRFISSSIKSFYQA
ncbi:MAG: DegT/DnrJ/EryC1/StrS family aminotransferase [Bacteroidetes bacterium]|nr:DegT/DnrJ/EryC1/StrS family aminotransferase [Bacteroidota bacterium]